MHPQWNDSLRTHQEHLQVLRLHLTWCVLWIGTVIGLRLVMFHKNARTQVQSRTRETAHVSFRWFVDRIILRCTHSVPLCKPFCAWWIIICVLTLISSDSPLSTLYLHTPLKIWMTNTIWVVIYCLPYHAWIWPFLHVLVSMLSVVVSVCGSVAT